MIIKNIKVDELEPFKTATGLTGRFRYRGPRRTIREHQDCSAEVAMLGVWTLNQLLTAACSTISATLTKQ
jgi:hypothetical protein